MKCRGSCSVVVCSVLALACGPAKSPGGGDTQADGSTSGATSEGTGTEAGGTETETETGDPEPDCDYDAYSACRVEVFAVYDQCMLDCESPDSCAGVACGWACLGARDYGVIECAEQQCPSRTGEESLCVAECHTLAGACEPTPDCHPHDCDFAEMVCVAENCHPCEVTALAYPHADDCTIELPGTVPSIKQVYTLLEVYGPDYMEWLVVDPADAACGDEPYIGGLWSLPDYDGITLCPEACEAWAGAGELTVEFATPPCE